MRKKYSHELSNLSTCKDLIVSAAVSHLEVAMTKKFVIIQILLILNE